MSGPGFDRRLQDFLASDEFEEDINRFLKKNAYYVVKESDISNNGIGNGEYSLEVHSIWKEYLEIIEKSLEEFQKSEKLSDIDFKKSIDDVSSRKPMLVKLMIASWEFNQFADICKEYIENEEEANNECNDNDNGNDDEQEYKNNYDNDNESKSSHK